MWFEWRRQTMHAEYWREKLENQKGEGRII